MTPQGALERLLQFSGVTAQDNVLDVACGPGLVSCAFAVKARKVTGIDLTPAFHHFPAPLLAWKEMVRVCQPGGTVLVADVAVPAEKAEAYDDFETLRDPSHTHALTLEQFPARRARLDSPMSALISSESKWNPMA